MGLLKRLIPRSLSGQLISLILIALLGGHLVALIILADERREALESATQGEVLARTATIARLLNVSPTDLQNQVMDNAQSPFVAFSISDASATANPPRSRRELLIASRLRAMLDNPNADVHVRLGLSSRFLSRDSEPEEEEDDHAEKNRNEFLKHHRDGNQWRRHFRWGIQLSVQLGNGQWLNAATQTPNRKSSWALQSLLALGLSILMIIGAVILSVRRITRPLATLAMAADAVGRGETTPDMAEEGPEDLQRTIRAFNRMRSRLETFVEDRTNLLAAVSHDLRSPVTSLRLRAEFIEDEQLRAEILETLSEMQTIIETTLIFAREETRTEDTRPTDLAALIESLVNDFKDQGKTCSYTGPERFVITGRPVSLKRAIRNLLENAITYGLSATATLIPGDSKNRTDHAIVIEDSGPGIPEQEIEHMFEPFVRLETSRSRETGGIGLGLAIARSIVRGHGGDIQAANKPQGGLRITIHLPQSAVD
ncbi:MAG: HAMP domain-containing protein [Rhodospirillales bacterium]|nr:HAMP domain-containing protein [Rhodospirillales bacterium]